MSVNRNNIIIVGEGDVGKTSLLAKFTDNKFDENQMTTHGVSFRAVDYNFDGLQLKFAVWDSSSLPQYREVSRLYYKDVSAALVVYSVINRSTLDRVNYWINTIRDHSNKVKYIALVGNKIDLRERFNPKHITRKEGLELALSKNVEFFECSAKIGLNVNELFSKTFDGMVKRYVLTPIQTSVLKYKAILLGDVNVGKSTIIERLCGHPFADCMESTIGTHFNSVICKMNQCSVVLEFWDTSAQTEDLSLMPMYYRNAHSVILVYDIRCLESFNNLNKYIDLVHRSCDEMPIIVLLGNKRDDKTRRQVELIDLKEFVEQNPIINISEEISAKFDNNFDKLLKKISRNLTNIFPNIPLHQNIRIKKIKKKNQNKQKIKNWFKCGAKYID